MVDIEFQNLVHGQIDQMADQLEHQLKLFAKNSLGLKDWELPAEDKSDAKNAVKALVPAKPPFVPFVALFLCAALVDYDHGQDFIHMIMQDRDNLWYLLSELRDSEATQEVLQALSINHAKMRDQYTDVRVGGTTMQIADLGPLDDEDNINAE